MSSNEDTKKPTDYNKEDQRKNRRDGKKTKRITVYELEGRVL